jgi:hypothetical protein
MRARRDTGDATNDAVALSDQQDVEDDVILLELEVAPTEMSRGQKRQLQLNYTKIDRLKVMERMIDEANRCGDKHIPSKAIKNFPQLIDVHQWDMGNQSVAPSSTRDYSREPRISPGHSSSINLVI